MKTPERQLTKYVREEDQEGLVNWLRSIDTTQRKQLKPLIQELEETYQRGIYHQEAHSQKRQLIAISAFVCINKNLWDFGAPWKILSYAYEAGVLKWHFPPWAKKFLQGLEKMDFLPGDFDYFLIMDMQKAGVFQPSDALIARLLPNILFENSYTEGKYQTQFKPERLKILPQTLESHLWLLFDYNTFLGATGTIDGKTTILWKYELKHLSDQGELDRLRLLKSSLGATLKNLNRDQIYWMADLFVYLEPSLEELFSVQDDLLAVLHSPLSKPVHTVLKQLKKIVQDPAFAREDFLSATDMLLGASTKTIVRATLGLLDQLARKNPDQQNLIAQKLCQVFIQSDKALQERGAKLLQKYGTTTDPILRAELEIWYDQMLAEPRKILAEFLSPTEEVGLESPDAESIVPLPPIISPENTLPAIESFDDYLYLLSQVLDNHEPWHFDLVLDATLRFFPEIDEKNLYKLEPVFQGAFVLFEQELRMGQGQLDYLMSSFLSQLALLLAHRLDRISDSFANLLHQYAPFKALKSKKVAFKAHIRPWRAISYNEELRIYQPYLRLCNGVLSRLGSPKGLPLLSTPTHLPYWIEPEVLVRRIRAYQQQKVPLLDVDLQLALARTALEDTQAALGLVEEMPKGELRRLLQYFFNPSEEAKRVIKKPELWFLAAVIKNPDDIPARLIPPDLSHLPKEFFNGNFPFAIQHKPPNLQIWHFNEKAPAKKLRVLNIACEIRDHAKPWEGFVETVKSFLVGPSSKDQPNYLPLDLDMGALFFKLNYTHFNQDISRLYAIFPNNPELFLGRITAFCFWNNAYWSEEAKRWGTATLNCMLAQRAPYGPMAHLFLAANLLCEVRVNRELAAEIWIQAQDHQRLDHQRLGKMLGEMLNKGLFPLKRLTDMLSQQLFDLSPRHNRGLVDLLEAMLPGLPQAPIRNTKKLLEIYHELLARTGQKLSNAEVKTKLTDWQSVKSLKKALQQLLAG